VRITSKKNLGNIINSIHKPPMNPKIVKKPLSVKITDRRLLDLSLRSINNKHSGYGLQKIRQNDSMTALNSPKNKIIAFSKGGGGRRGSLEHSRIGINNINNPISTRSKNQGLSGALPVIKGHDQSNQYIKKAEQNKYTIAKIEKELAEVRKLMKLSKR